MGQELIKLKFGHLRVLEPEESEDSFILFIHEDITKKAFDICTKGMQMTPYVVYRVCQRCHNIEIPIQKFIRAYSCHRRARIVTKFLSALLGDEMAW